MERELDWEPVLNPPELDEIPEDLPEKKWWAWIHQHRPDVYEAEMEKGIRHATPRQSLEAHANFLMLTPFERLRFVRC